jgi:hypothetical protein
VPDPAIIALPLLPNCSSSGPRFFRAGGIRDEEFLLLACRIVENQSMEIEIVYCQA